MELAGTVAIITGGGTGIGKAVGERLAEAGARAIVVNYSRSREEAEATAAELREGGCEAVNISENASTETFPISISF